MDAVEEDREIMELKDIIHILKAAERQGADKDDPEGARFICISETLADKMIEALEQYRTAQLELK